MFEKISRVKWSNPGKGVAPFPTPRCSSYWKGRLWVTLDCSRQLYFLQLVWIQSFPSTRLVFLPRQENSTSPTINEEPRIDEMGSCLNIYVFLAWMFRVLTPNYVILSCRCLAQLHLITRLQYTLDWPLLSHSRLKIVYEWNLSKWFY